jgi:hypothetical protein
MAGIRGAVTQVWRETRGNIFVEVVKHIAGATVLKSVGSALWGLLTPTPLYWHFLVAEFGIGLFLFIGAIYLQMARKKPSGSAQDASSVARTIGPANSQRKLPHEPLFSPIQIQAIQLIRG